MKYLSVIICLLFGGVSMAQVIKTTSTSVSFFSNTLVEDISAKNSKMAGAINTKTNAIAFSIPIRSFEFEKSLMQEHFNENYMESGKYPNASFKGVINGSIDYLTDGTYPISATGMLNIHGKEQKRTINGTAVVRNGVFTITSAFVVKLIDHNIDRPAILFQNIAENIDVKITAQFKTN